MGNPSQAQDLSRTLQANEESRGQADSNTRLSTQEPPSGGSAESKEGEGKFGSQGKNQTNEHRRFS
jgi:hypothetical protein